MKTILVLSIYDPQFKKRKKQDHRSQPKSPVNMTGTIRNKTKDTD